MKVRITSINENAPEEKEERETALTFHQFILADMGLYADMEELIADWDKTEFKEGYAFFKNEGANGNYQHVYEAVG